MASAARINPDIIRWARERIGLSPEEIATSQIPAERIRAWEAKESLPTHAQAEKLAERLRIPFLVLFLSDPPELEVQIPDLRTLSGEPPVNPSIEFVEVVNDALLRQDWYRQYQIDNGAPAVPAVGKFSLSDPPQVIAEDIRRILQLTKEVRQQCMSWKEYFTHAIGTAEAAGILIFRSAVVRHATNRPLSVKEFRGFVLSDRYAPVIFINDNDARAAQMFTLAHEAAHVWLNQKGIVDVDFKKKPADLANSIERFCNYVAAEVLVPEVEFRQAWKASTIDLLSRHYRVSTLVILRRAYELGLIPEQQYWRQFEAKYQWYRQRDKPEKKEESKKAKGNFWASFTIRNSARFTRGVVGAVREGRARYSDAATLLGVKTASLERFLLRTGSASQA